MFTGPISDSNQTKRVRRRPNMIHVDMDDRTREKLDACLAWYRDGAKGKMFTITGLIHLFIADAYRIIPGENKNNS